MSASRKKPWTPPHRTVLGLVCLIFVLMNAFDALATIEIVRRGGEEANPLARPMFERGNLPFFLWKMGLALVCSVALALLARSRRAAWWLLCSAAAAYAALAGLHVYLLWFVRHP